MAGALGVFGGDSEPELLAVAALDAVAVCVAAADELADTPTVDDAVAAGVRLAVGVAVALLEPDVLRVVVGAADARLSEASGAGAAAGVQVSQRRGAGGELLNEKQLEAAFERLLLLDP